MLDKVLPVWVDTFEMAATTLIAAIDTVVIFMRDASLLAWARRHSKSRTS
jgi:hypothetical protein